MNMMPSIPLLEAAKVHCRLGSGVTTQDIVLLNGIGGLVSSAVFSAEQRPAGRQNKTSVGVAFAEVTMIEGAA
jgi:hypothetical protein